MTTSTVLRFRHQLLPISVLRIHARRSFRLNTSMSTAAQLSIQEVAKSASAQPGLPRSGHAAAPLPEWHAHDAIMLGGYTERASTGQMERRECMEGWVFNKQGGGSWQPINFAEGPVPEPRLVSQSVVVGDCLYLIGGWNPGGPIPFLNDIWRLNLRINRWQKRSQDARHFLKWEKLHPEGEPLPAISRHQAAAVGSCIYIHHHRSTGDITLLDVSDPSHPRLSKVPVKGDVPSCRGLHSLTAVPASPGSLPTKLFLFGGAPQHGPMMSDLYALDLKSMEWTRCTPSGLQPHARCAHGAAAAPLGRYLIIHGGAFYIHQLTGGGGLQVLDDTQCFDTKENKWTPLTSIEGSLPAARNAHCLVPISSSANEFVLHGGWVPFVKTFNDSHIIRLNI